MEKVPDEMLLDYEDPLSAVQGQMSFIKYNINVAASQVPKD